MNYNKNTQYTVGDVRTKANAYNWQHRLKTGVDRTRCKVFDSSGGCSYGYGFELVEQKGIVTNYDGDHDDSWETVRTVANSKTVYDETEKNAINKIGCWREVFNKTEIDAITVLQVTA